MKFIAEYDKNDKKSYECFCVAYVDQLKGYLKVDESKDRIIYSLELPILNDKNSSNRHDIEITVPKKDKEVRDIWNLVNSHN